MLPSSSGYVCPSRVEAAGAVTAAMASVCTMNVGQGRAGRLDTARPHAMVMLASPSDTAAFFPYRDSRLLTEACSVASEHVRRSRSVTSGTLAAQLAGTDSAASLPACQQERLMPFVWTGLGQATGLRAKWQRVKVFVSGPVQGRGPGPRASKSVNFWPVTDSASIGELPWHMKAVMERHCRSFPARHAAR